MILHQRPIIARQGLLPIVVVLILASLLHYNYGWQLASTAWILAVVTVFLFRDPRRQVPPSPLGIVAPIDGRVVSVTQERDPYLDRDALRIKMRGSWWGVFSVRSAMEGKVNKQWFGSLPNGNNSHLYAKSKVPVFAQWTQSDEGDDLVTTLSPRIVKNGVRCDVQSGERIGQGKRCGFIPFGVNAETFLPANTRVEVNPGDTIKAGTRIIATLVR